MSRLNPTARSFNPRRLNPTAPDFEPGVQQYREPLLYGDEQIQYPDQLYYPEDEQNISRVQGLARGRRSRSRLTKNKKAATKIQAARRGQRSRRSNKYWRTGTQPMPMKPMSRILEEKLGLPSRDLYETVNTGKNLRKSIKQNSKRLKRQQKGIDELDSYKHGKHYLTERVKRFQDKRLEESVRDLDQLSREDPQILEGIRESLKPEVYEEFLSYRGTVDPDIYPEDLEMEEDAIDEYKKLEDKRIDLEQDIRRLQTELDTLNQEYDPHEKEYKRGKKDLLYKCDEIKALVDTYPELKDDPYWKEHFIDACGGDSSRLTTTYFNHFMNLGSSQINPLSGRVDRVIGRINNKYMRRFYKDRLLNVLEDKGLTYRVGEFPPRLGWWNGAGDPKQQPFYYFEYLVLYFRYTHAHKAIISHIPKLPSQSFNYGRLVGISRENNIIIHGDPHLDGGDMLLEVLDEFGEQCRGDTDPFKIEKMKRIFLMHLMGITHKITGLEGMSAVDAEYGYWVDRNSGHVAAPRSEGLMRLSEKVKHKSKHKNIGRRK